MPSNQSKDTIRIDSKLLEKFRYIAEYNGRSGNRELEFLMKMYVKKFEMNHGKIEID